MNSVTPPSFLCQPGDLWDHLLSLSEFDLMASDGGSWNDLADFIQDQGLSSLVGSLPHSHPLMQTAPPLLIKHWREETARTKNRHRLNRVLTLRISRLLQAKDIDCFWIKGPVLYEQSYRSLFPRRYEDLDLVVRPEQVDVTLQVLVEAGYRRPHHPLVEKALRRFHFHTPLVHMQPAMTKLELHWHLIDFTNLYRIQLGDLFDRHHRGDPDAGVLPHMEANDQLLYLALHVAKHGLQNIKALKQGRPLEWYLSRAAGNRLSWFLDLALNLQHHGDVLDPERLKQRMHAWHIADEVQSSLSLTEMIFPGCGAQRLLSQLDFKHAYPEAGSQPAHKHQQQHDRLLSKGQEIQPTLIVRPARFIQLPAQLFPSPAKLQSYYQSPRLLTPLLYLTHPFHLFWKTLKVKQS
ncbi:nucleotidyltransferase family protein [Kiritimatiellota bacterium B12222]|nr:nucleotidyltransferase family protein [Kiritimatiellota bacterium B12222]